jgi:hypothetical protein
MAIIKSIIGAMALGRISPRHCMSLMAQKDRQSRYSDKQRTHVSPEWSRRNNEWAEENQNMHNACGNSPTSRRGLFLPDGFPRCSTDSGDDQKECHAE